MLPTPYEESPLVRQVSGVARKVRPFVEPFDPEREPGRGEVVDSLEQGGDGCFMADELPHDPQPVVRLVGVSDFHGPPLGVQPASRE